MVRGKSYSKDSPHPSYRENPAKVTKYIFQKSERNEDFFFFHFVPVKWHLQCHETLSIILYVLPLNNPDKCSVSERDISYIRKSEILICSQPHPCSTLIPFHFFFTQWLGCFNNGLMLLGKVYFIFCFNSTACCEVMKLKCSIVKV